MDLVDRADIFDKVEQAVVAANTGHLCRLVLCLQDAQGDLNFCKFPIENFT